jgi:DNA repair protein RecO (recombination protein O)
MSGGGSDGRGERRSFALLLRTVDYGEADRVATFLTRDFGKRTVFAAGARKSTKRYAGALEPLRMVSLHWAERNEGLGRLLGATVEEGYDGIARDLHPLYWASVCLEWTADLTVEGEASPIFDRALGFLRWLHAEQRGAWYVEAGCLRYGLILLLHHGALPTLDHCHRTGVPLEEMAAPWFSYEGGGLLDAEAVRPEDLARPVEVDAVRYLIAVAQGRFPSEADITALRGGREIVLSLFRSMLERQPKALELLRTVWL